MAVLSETDRVGEWSNYMSELSAVGGTYDLLKAEVRAAIDAVDDWVDANLSSFNTALPIAARTALSSSQKARLLLFIVEKRFIAGV